jgi:hypothetical protein
MPDDQKSDSNIEGGVTRSPRSHPNEEFQFVIPRPMKVGEAVRVHGLFIATLLIALAGTIIVASRPVEPEVARLNARIVNAVSNNGEVADLQKQLLQTQAALSQTEKALGQNQQALRLALNPNPASAVGESPHKQPSLDAKGYVAEIKHIREAIFSANREIVADERSLKQNLIALAANRQALAFAELDLAIAKGAKPPGSVLSQKEARDFLSADEQSIPLNAARLPTGFAMLAKPLSGSLDNLRALAIEETALLSDCEETIRTDQLKIGTFEAEIRKLQEQIGTAHLAAQALRSAATSK